MAHFVAQTNPLGVLKQPRKASGTDFVDMVLSLLDWLTTHKKPIENYTNEKIFYESHISKINSRRLPGLFQDPQWIGLSYKMSH